MNSMLAWFRDHINKLEYNESTRQINHSRTHIFPWVVLYKRNVQNNLVRRNPSTWGIADCLCLP